MRSSRYGKRRNKKRATCFATFLQNELNSDVARYTTHIKPVLQQIRVVKRATSLFNSFCSNVAKQVARFLFPVFPYFNKFNGANCNILAALVRRGDIFTHPSSLRLINLHTFLNINRVRSIVACILDKFYILHWTQQSPGGRLN